MKMTKLMLMAAAMLLMACSHPRPPTVANVGHGGSIGAPYVLDTLFVQDTRGGGADFGYGAVWGYPGKSSSIGIGVPKYISGYWIRQAISKDHEPVGTEEFYHISAPIDAKLAAQKIEMLNHYYKNFHPEKGVMQVTVERERVRVFYTLACFSKIDDCTIRDDIDKNNWVQRSLNDTTHVVLLFDGKGEASKTPFSDSPYAKRHAITPK